MTATPTGAHVPMDLIGDHRVTDSAVRVYMVLATTRVGEPVDHKVIAHRIHRSPRSVNRMVAELDRAGWITREQTKVGEPTTYLLHSTAVAR